MVTASNTIETVVKCVRMGAANYVVKPVMSSQLIAMVQQALLLGNVKRECAILREKLLLQELHNPEAFQHIVTASRSMGILFQYIEAIAHSGEPILITGETGVGKELVASSIHQASGCKGLFVPVNIAGLDDNTFSDALFGHHKGAFTGADKARAGLIETAEDGTLFLDEIGDLNHASQVTLLRLLQENEYHPLGADFPKRSTARVIVATHKNIEKMQETGAFRKDLYYRLRTHHVHVPPLRERVNDIPLLLHSFVEAACEALHRTEVPEIPLELVQLLSSYAFPGNVRELRAMVYDAVSHHHQGALPLQQFRKNMRAEGMLAPRETRPTDSVYAQLEVLPDIKQAQEELIDEALKRTNHNQAAAARLLGITPQALSQRLKHRK